MIQQRAFFEHLGDEYACARLADDPNDLSAAGGVYTRAYCTRVFSDAFTVMPRQVEAHGCASLNHQIDADLGAGLMDKAIDHGQAEASPSAERFCREEQSKRVH